MQETVVIVNPRAANGRTVAAFERLAPLMPGPFDVLRTGGPREATRLTAEALRAGARTIVAAGGDGTIHEVANGFLDRDGRMLAPDARLAILPLGTGSDFRRSAGIPFDPRAAVALLRTGTPRRIDVFRVDYTAHNGESETCFAVNVVSFGLGGAVAERANRTSKAFGGGLSFLWATCAGAWSYKPQQVEIRVDQRSALRQSVTQVAVGNGQFQGGGMWICPGAAIDDRSMNVTVVGGMNFLEVVLCLPTLYKGAIYSHPKVQPYRAERVAATSKETVLIEIDGEPLGRLPVTVSLVPSALTLLGA